jgi:ubiquitin C-terminal hydrolase
MKQVSIKAPPKHLIIHLKRFEFDFETMQQAKVNDKYAT